MKRVLFNPHRESTRIDIFVSEPFVICARIQNGQMAHMGRTASTVLRIEALIAMKEAAGRPQDLADAALLRDILGVQRDQVTPS
jgi:hypothetical protein